ncbi:MAG: hypothetical protein U5J83_02860 [Bryobacterales bacterium]|nr:hypothetical protein [Bryobacterales bacterium]
MSGEVYWFAFEVEMNAYLRMYSLGVSFVLVCLLAASVATAQEAASVPRPGSATPGVVTGQKAPLAGEFRPAPQPDPTRIIALVPVVDVPGIAGARAPLFLEDNQSPVKQAPERLKLDSSKAEVPSGIVAFRAVYSDDGEWALVDLEARDASALERVRQSKDARVRIFTASELESSESARAVAMPKGLSLSLLLQP